jgi:hypothetical protein
MLVREGKQVSDERSNDACEEISNVWGEISDACEKISPDSKVIHIPSLQSKFICGLVREQPLDRILSRRLRRGRHHSESCHLSTPRDSPLMPAGFLVPVA